MSQVSSSIRVRSTYQLSWWARSPHQSEFIPSTSSLDEPGLFINQSSFHLPVLLMDQVSSSIIVLSTFPFPWWARSLHLSEFFPPTSPLMSRVFSSIRVLSTYQSLDEPGLFFIYHISFHVTVPLMSQVSSSIRVLSIYQFSWWARSLHLSKLFPPTIPVMNQVSSSIRVLSTYQSLDEPGLFFIYQSSFHVTVPLMSQVSSSIRVLSIYQFSWWARSLHLSKFFPPTIPVMNQVSSSIRVLSTYQLPALLMSQVSSSIRVISIYQFPWWARSLYQPEFFPPTSSLDEPGLFIYQSSFHLPVPLLSQVSSSIRVLSTYPFPWWTRTPHLSEYVPPTSFLDEPGLFINQSSFHLPVPLMSQVSSSIIVSSTYQFPWWVRSLHLSEFFPPTSSLDEPGLFIYHSSFQVPVPSMSQVSSSIRVLSIYQFSWWARSLHHSEFFPPISSLDEPGLFIYQSLFHLPVPLMSQVFSSIWVRSTYQFPWWARSLHRSELFPPTSPLMSQVSSSIRVLSTYQFPWWARSLHLSEFVPHTSPLMSQVSSSIRFLSTYQSLVERGLFIYQSSFHLTVPWWARSLHLSEFFPPTSPSMSQVSSSIRVLSTY